MERIIEQLQNRLVEMDQRVNRLELKLASGASGGAEAPRSFAAAAPRAYAPTPAPSQPTAIKDLHDTVDPDALADASQRVFEQFAQRNIDERCTKYWEEHPESHLDLVNDVEDEDLPPGRDASRDESPYWMTRLHHYLSALKSGDMNQIQAAVSKGAVRTKPLVDHEGVCVGKCSVNGKGGVPPNVYKPQEFGGKGGKSKGKGNKKGPYY